MQARKLDVQSMGAKRGRVRAAARCAALLATAFAVQAGAMPGQIPAKAPAATSANVPERIPAMVDAHRAMVSGYAAPATSDDVLERTLRFRAAVARDPGQYVWIVCEAGGRSLRIVHGDDFGALQARSIAEVSRIGWSSLLQPQRRSVSFSSRCGEYRIAATEGYFDKQSFPVVSVTRAGTTVVPPTALSFATCTRQLGSGASVEHCPDLNARIVAAQYDAESDLTHVTLTGTFILPQDGEEGMHYTLYQQ